MSELLSEYDADLRCHVATATVFTGTSGQIQNNVIGVGADVLNDTIKEQISRANYIAVVVDESIDVSNAAQMSCLFPWYVTDNRVELFFQFEDAEDKHASKLAPANLNFLDSYECKSKAAAQCYDGAAVMATRITGHKQK